MGKKHVNRNEYKRQIAYMLITILLWIVYMSIEANILCMLNLETPSIWGVACQSRLSVPKVM